MIFEAYSPNDKACCLAIFDSNVPTFFLPSERGDFESFLDEPRGHYLVMRDNDHRIVGCGGVASKDDTIILAWGMIHASLHRRGLGRALLAERLLRARNLFRNIDRARIETSQHSAAFFVRSGFVMTSLAKNGFGPGLDCVTMECLLEEVSHR